MNIAFVIFGIITLVACILWGVDFYNYLKNRYCRYHIGRWHDYNSWKDAVIRKSIRWSIHAPTVKITDNNRYLLLDMLNGRHRSRTIQSWQTGAVLLGLSSVHAERCESAVQNSINRLIDDNGNFVCRPTNVDCGMLAYSILKASNPQKVKPAMDYAAQLIRNHVASDGMIVYVNDMNSDERYVDTLGLACPFLAHYAAVYGKPEYARLALEQLKQFSQYGLEPCSLLPNHAYSSSAKLPLGVYGWGRGAGWYVIGLIDTYKELPDCDDKNWLETQLKLVADSYLMFHHDDGGFGSIMQMKNNGYDSSATAAMAYFYRECGCLFDDIRYHEAADKCLNKLRSVTRISGAIDWCQGDTKGIGIFSQTYDIMPFAQGMAVRSMQK